MTAWAYRALAILGCALATAPSFAAEKTFEQRFNAPTGGQLTLDADVGSVAIVGRDSRELVVHADMEGSDDFLANLSVSAVQSATGVTVTERVAHWGFSNWFESGPQRVRFTIEVPRDYPVDLHTSGGSIKVAHCTGDLDVKTSGGPIRLEDIDGKVTARTSGGGITAQVRSNRGISLETSGGGITLVLPANARASIDAHTSGGPASSSIPLSSTEIASHNRLQGDINGGGAPIFLRTSGGGIRIAAME